MLQTFKLNSENRKTKKKWKFGRIDSRFLIFNIRLYSLLVRTWRRQTWRMLETSRTNDLVSTGDILAYKTRKFFWNAGNIFVLLKTTRFRLLDLYKNVISEVDIEASYPTRHRLQKWQEQSNRENINIDKDVKIQSFSNHC